MLRRCYCQMLDACHDVSSLALFLFLPFSSHCLLFVWFTLLLLSLFLSLSLSFSGSLSLFLFLSLSLSRFLAISRSVSLCKDRPGAQVSKGPSTYILNIQCTAMGQPSGPTIHSYMKPFGVMPQRDSKPPGRGQRSGRPPELGTAASILRGCC